MAAAKEKRLDWSWGPGTSPTLGAANAAATTFLAANATHLAGFDPLWGVVGAVGVTAATTVSAAFASTIQGMPLRVLCYRTACWLSAGTWAAWSLSDGGSHVTLGKLGVLAAGTAAAAVAGQWGAATSIQQEQQALADQKAAAAAAAANAAKKSDKLTLAESWEATIMQVCHLDVEVINIEPFPKDTGYWLEVILPASGSTVATLAASAKALAAARRLPINCGVEVLPGVDHGRALLGVSTHNSLADKIHTSRDYSVRSINDPIAVGVYKDGSPAVMPFRQESTLISGQKGSGKTETMNTVIAKHLLCDDVINVVIDLNNGGLAMPWLLAWRRNRHRVKKPPFAVVARTPEQALQLTEFILDVVKDRKTAYAHLKLAHNVSLLPLGRETGLSLIQVFVDECAELLGDRKKPPIVRRVQENLEEIQRIARDSGGNLVISALGPTTEMIGSTHIKKQSGNRLALRSDTADLTHMFGHSAALNPAETEYKGSGFLQVGLNQPIRPEKMTLTEPEQIEEIVIATDDRRPDLDERALSLPSRTVTIMDENGKEHHYEVGPHVWQQAWDDDPELLATLDAGADAIDAIRAGQKVGAVAAPAAASHSINHSTSTKEEKSMSKVNLGDAVANMVAALEAAKAAEPLPPSGGDGEVPVDGEKPDPARWAEIERAWAAPAVGEAGQAPEQPASPVDWWTRTLQLLHAAGPQGAGAQAIAEQLAREEYKTTRQTVSDRLKQEAAKGGGLVAQAKPRDPYVHRDHVGS